MDDDTSLTCLDLYCDEDPFDSTPPHQPPPPPEQPQHQHDDQQAAAGAVQHVRSTTTTAPAPDDEEVEYYKAKERLSPQRDLRRHLLLHHHGLSAARFKAVSYIIYAVGRLGLAAATAFNAVNYVDRFLSINCHLRWEEWMVELVSVACLSVACKLDELTIPSLHHLQMEELMGHSFRASTIRDMELTLLKALQWRLVCVTPFSFLPTAAAASSCTALLLRSLLDPSFLRFDASLVAASALTCLQQPHLSTSLVNRLIHPLCQTDNEVKECFNMMKALYSSMDPCKSSSEKQWSPISVIPFQTADGAINRSAVSRRLFDQRKPQSDYGTAQDEVISQTKGN